MWLACQTPEKVLLILQKFVEGAKEEFAGAVANDGGVYAVGYCFGGKYVLLLDCCWVPTFRMLMRRIRNPSMKNMVL